MLINIKEEIDLAVRESLLFDNEYVIMSEVAENENVTQRELSKKLGMSVSTVNVLINKMIREGLIKMTQVSQKQVLYMLTPVGIMEKAKKTAIYLKAHYRAIFDTKEKIKFAINMLNQEYDIIYVLICNDEMGEILAMVAHEYKSKHNKANIQIIKSKKEIDMKDYCSSILLHMADNEEVNKIYSNIANLKIINITERL